MRSGAVVLALSVLLASCSGSPDSYRVAPEPEGTDRCGAGCARLKELSCEEANGSDPSDPDSCRKDCEYVQREGKVDLNVACWPTISRCEELETKCGGPTG